MRPAIVLGVAGLLLLSACAGTTNEAASSRPAPTHAAAAPPTDLPSGDPGLDASAVPDPGAPKGPDADRGRARKVVPLESMLGGQWQESSASPLGCISDLDEVAQRTVAYRSTGGLVLQTVATHQSHAVADHAVRDMSRELLTCGCTVHPDPRLGSASTAASSAGDTRTAVVVAAEGVTVTMVGSDSAITQMARWSSLVDMALGNSCAAAPDGCH